MLTRTVTLLSLICGLVLAATGAYAQAFPTKPVRLVVPASPGGTLDFFARLTATPLTEILGQPVVVENKPGASFMIGTDAVAKADPDGYTLLVAPSTIATINPLAFPAQASQSVRDLRPITLATTNVFVLLVNSMSPIRSVDDLLVELRRNPGKSNHASNSYSTILMSELLKSLANVSYTDVTYKGAAPAVGSTASGETQFCFVDLGSAVPAIRSGLVRILAVTTPKRYRLQPDIPTLGESGMPGYTYVAWTIVFAPRATPAPVVERLNAAYKQVLAMPGIATRIQEMGMEVYGNAADAAAQELRVDAERWERLVQDRGIRFR